jgi:hypothetical protein
LFANKEWVRELIQKNKKKIKKLKKLINSEPKAIKSNDSLDSVFVQINSVQNNLKDLKDIDVGNLYKKFKALLCDSNNRYTKLEINIHSKIKA